MLSSAVNRARAARKNDKGFTLIELLIVIIILGVLAGIVVFSVRGVNNKSKQAACKTEYRTVDTAIEAYYAANNVLPTQISDLVPGFLHSAPTDWVTGITAGSATGTACP